MFARKFSCVIKCTDCGSVRQWTGHLSPFPMTSVGEEVADQAPHCSNCRSKKLEVRNIICEMLPLRDYDICGHIYQGRWECPKGCLKELYPAMVKRALNKELDKDRLYSYAQKYIGMDSLGYPPKCIKCQSYLIYHEGGQL